MGRHWPVRVLLLLVASVTAASASPANPPQNPTDEELRVQARKSVHQMMDGDLDGSIQISKEIQKADQQSPLGYMLEADAVWWKIYYSTANLIDPDVFAVANLPTTPHDSHFEDLVKITIAKSEARIKANQDVARNHFYQGMAYALRARLEGLRDKDLPTARAGKKMRALLMETIQLDPNLTDAYLGLGIYNYFVDTLSGIVKILRFFIGLPGGSRVTGLEQLRLCAEKGDLARSEARFYLAKDYSRANERQYERSLHLFKVLAHEHPNNPMWPMLVASLHCRMGNTQPCEAGYREVMKKTTDAMNDVQDALHRASHVALQRMHPGEDIE